MTQENQQQRFHRTYDGGHFTDLSWCGGNLPCSLMDWDSYLMGKLYQEKRKADEKDTPVSVLNSSNVELGLQNNFFTPDGGWGIRRDHVELPFIDFKGRELLSGTRHDSQFWDFLKKKFPGKKIYIFDSGNSYHGIVECALDSDTWYSWKVDLENFCHQVQDEDRPVVDTAWVGHGANILRFSSGLQRPQPYLKCWINL